MKFNRQPLPKDGDRRIMRKFAVFPIRIDNVTVWLEHYNSHYKFRTGFRTYGWDHKKNTLIHNIT